MLEARLQLNEGRLAFAHKDLEAATAPKDALRVRVETAAAGFQAVLEEPAAGTGSKTRAQIGLKAARALLDAPLAQRLALVSRGRWGAAPARIGSMTPLKGGWSRITVHHSAESSSDPEGASLDDSIRTTRLIQKFHMEDAEHRWGDIGYHFVIDSAGRILEGRDLRWQGAHAGGPNNLQNLGICLLGDLTRKGPTEEALTSLRLLLDDLRQQNRIPAARVFMHHDFQVTTCPGPILTAWVRRYKAQSGG